MNKSFLLRYVKRTWKPIAGCFLFLAVFGMMFQSCIKKEDFDFNKITFSNWSPIGAAPLIHSKLSLHDILSANQLFQEDANHFLTLVYRSSVFSEQADQLINIQDQSINTNIGFSTGGITIGDSVVIPPQSVNFAFTTTNGERYDSILIKTGNFNFSINGNLNHDARIYITIPGARKNGLPFNKTIYYDYSGSLPVIDVCDLDGYTLYFAPGNQITINYSVAVYGDANPDTSPYNISIGESITGIKFFKIFGYLGQINFPFNKDSVMLDIFKNNMSGSLMFDDPKLNIYVNNAFGMPLAFTIDTLNAYSPVNPPYVLAINSTIPYPWPIAAPTFAQIGQSIESFLQLNKTNSNIDQAINMAPYFLACHANTLTNPSGNPLTDQNFVIDTSKIGLDVELEIPLSGSAWNFVLQDTIDFNMGKDIDKIEWALFKINTTNGFPIDVNMQVYFADSLGNKLDSLFVPIEQVISSGIVGPAPDYRVTSPTHKHTESHLDENKLSHLGNTKKLILYTRLTTINNGSSIIKLYSDYDIDVKIGMQVKIKSLN
ncbi:MAG: hypothetical protein WC599_02280 [Bacteroidales bacterium]